MDVTLDIMIAMPTLHAQTLTAATSVHAINCLLEMVSIAQVSEKISTSRKGASFFTLTLGEE